MKIKFDNGIAQTKCVEFIDREEERAFFWEKYDALCEVGDEWQVTVMNYWGMGGIGKSQILKKLMLEAGARTEGLQDKIPVVYIALSEQDTPIKIMNKIVAKLRQSGFEFPIYEAALFALAKISGSSNIKQEIRSLEEKSPLISGLLDLAAIHPTSGVAAAVAKFADKTTKHCRERIQNKKTELEALERMLPEELEIMLPEYFAKDLHWNVNSILSTYPVVLFLDKLEALRKRITGVDEVDMQLGWLKDTIVAQVPKLVWVCSSRERLTWDQRDEWKDSLFHIRVNAFDERWVSEYFKVNRMETDAYFQELFALTKGVPLYLDICCELYRKLEQKGETIDFGSFGGRQERLLMTYLENLTEAEEHVLFVLSCIGDWDEEFIRFLAQKSTQSSFMDAYNILRKKSYIDEVDGKSELHQVIREQIFAYCGETVLRSTADAIYEYMPKDQFSWYYPKYLRCRLKCIKTDGEIDAWWEEPDLQLLKALAQSGNINGFEACYRVIGEFTRGRFDDAAIHVFLSVFHIRNLIRLKCDRQAQREANYMIRVCKDSKKQVNDTFRNLASEFFELKAQALDGQKKYEQALKIRQALCSDVACAGTYTRISRMHNLMISYQNLKQYDKAFEALEKVVEYRRRSVDENPEDLIRALMLRVHLFLEYYEANTDRPGAMALAQQYGKELHDEAHRLLDDKAPLLIDVDMVYARLMTKLHLWQQACPVLEDVYDRLLAINQGQNAYVDETALLLATALTETGQYQRALPLFEKLEDNARKYPEGSELFLLRCRLEKGIAMSQSGQHEAAGKYLAEAFREGVKQYGYQEVIVLQLAYSAAVEEYFLGNYDACSNQLRALLPHARALLSDGSIVVYMIKKQLLRCEQSRLES